MRRVAHAERSVTDRLKGLVAASHAIVNALVECGYMDRPALCSACGREPAPTFDGKPGIVLHHDDYSKPLDVRALCRPCHRQWHVRTQRGRGEGALFGPLPADIAAMSRRELTGWRRLRSQLGYSDEGARERARWMRAAASRARVTERETERRAA